MVSSSIIQNLYGLRREAASLKFHLSLRGIQLQIGVWFSWLLPVQIYKFVHKWQE